MDQKLKNKILIIGPRSGQTITGVTIAFDSLSDYLRETKSDHKEVNLNYKGKSKKRGGFKIKRMVHMLYSVFQAWVKLLFVKQVYLIISSSSLGFIKDFLVINVAWILRKKITLHLHGGGYRNFYSNQSSFRQTIIRSTLLRSDAIIVIGELLKNQFDFLNKPEIIHVVMNGIAQPTGNVSVPSPKKAPKEKQPWKILYLSNLMETKGYFVLLEAAQKLSGSDTEFNLDFCGGFIESVAESDPINGGANLEEKFKSIINTSPMDSVVTYHGVVSGDQKNKILQEAHVLVLPTWYPWEGQPISIIEAMSCGTLVISTRHAGISELIDHNKTGWMIEMDNINAEELSSYLNKMMNLSVNEYEIMSKNSIDKYLNSFTREQHLTSLINTINLTG